MDYIGKTFINKTGLEYTPIRKVVSTIKMSRYSVRFSATGYETEAYRHNIRDGRVKDKLVPVMYGVGCIGSTCVPLATSQEYMLWKCMIARCYNPSNDNYKNYGSKGVTVCARWLNFSNFYEDITSIEGYNEELFKAKLITLDKDKKQVGVDNKVYSIETCCFLSHKEQNDYAVYKVVSFRAVSPEGVEYTTANANKFAKEHGLDPSSVHKALHGKLKTVAKWKFYSSDDTCNDYPARE